MYTVQYTVDLPCHLRLYHRMITSLAQPLLFFKLWGWSTSKRYGMLWC